MPVTIDLAQINFRKGTAAQWTTANPLLIVGEPGLETDTKLMKIGDGVTLWNALGYMPEQLAAQINLATAKTVPVDADAFGIVDSAASNVIKKVTWASIKATLLTWLNTIINLVLTAPTEVTNIVAAAPSATQAIDSDTSQDWLFTTNAANNFIINLRATSSISLNTRMTVGETKTFVIRVTNAATTWYMTAIQIDAGAITPKWQGTAPTVGDASARGVYTFAVTKTAASTYEVLASYTKFA